LTTNPMWTGPRSNQILRGKRPRIDRMSHGTDRRSCHRAPNGWGVRSEGYSYASKKTFTGSVLTERTSLWLKKDTATARLGRTVLPHQPFLRLVLWILPFTGEGLGMIRLSIKGVKMSLWRTTGLLPTRYTRERP
jgi:hypothetical protein